MENVNLYQFCVEDSTVSRRDNVRGVLVATFCKMGSVLILHLGLIPPVKGIVVDSAKSVQEGSTSAALFARK